MKSVSLAVRPQHVVKECTKLGPAELGTGARYDLHQALKVKLCANCNSSAVKDFESARFFA